MGSYQILKEVKGFDWDKGNAEKNWIRHNVRDRESEEIFFNKPLIINFDKEHSGRREKRFQALGQTNQKRKLLIVFTIRNKKIKIISARDQSRKEGARYEKI